MVPLEVQGRRRDGAVEVLQRGQAARRLVVARAAHPSRRDLEPGTGPVAADPCAEPPSGALLAGDGQRGQGDRGGPEGGGLEESPAASPGRGRGVTLEHRCSFRTGPRGVRDPRNLHWSSPKRNARALDRRSRRHSGFRHGPPEHSVSRHGRAERPSRDAADRPPVPGPDTNSHSVWGGPGAVNARQARSAGRHSTAGACPRGCTSALLGPAWAGPSQRPTLTSRCTAGSSAAASRLPGTKSRQGSLRLCNESDVHPARGLRARPAR